MRRTPRINGLVVGAIIVGALALLPVPAQFPASGSAQDEAILVVYPERILEGDVPNKDFQHLYAPGHAWVMAGVFALTETSVGVERAVGLLYRIAIVLAVFMLAATWGAGFAIGCALIATMLVTALGMGAFAWVGALALALWGLAAAALLLEATESDSKWRDRGFFVAGMLTTLALLFRLDMILAVGASAAALVGLMPPDRRRRYLWGALAGLAPWAVHIALAGPAAVVEGLVADPLRMAPGRRLPLPPADPQTRGLLYVVVTAAVIVAAAGALAVRHRRRDLQSRLLLVMGLFALGTLPQALQRATVDHLLYVGCVSVAFAPPALLWLLDPERPRMPTRSRQALACALVLGVLIAAAPAFSTQPTVDLARMTMRGDSLVSFAVTHDGRRWPVPSDEEAEVLSAVAGELDARAPAGARLFVGPRDLRRSNYNDTFLYFLLDDLEPASYFMEMNPKLANRPGSGLAEDIASADYLVLTDRYDAWNEPNASMDFGPTEPSDVVAQEFCPFRTFPATFGTYELFERCDAT